MAAELLIAVAAVTNPDRRARSNPGQGKRSLSHPTRPADPAKRPTPRGFLTLVMDPLTYRES
ncbi:MAG: hypothetical protein ACYDC9_02385 [Dermatophilaceae bacterium]